VQIAARYQAKDKNAPLAHGQVRNQVLEMRV